MKRMLFSTVDVTRQVFYRTPLSYAIVNLKPIVPGHVLVLPRRVVTRLKDLEGPELADLMSSAQHVGRVIERVYGADGLTIACQDGVAAGQTMPHVHFHLLPRKLRGDRFAQNNDEIYPAIERAAGTLPQDLGVGAAAASKAAEEGRTDQGAEPLKVDAEEDRKPRTMEEMVQEAEWLRTFFDDQPEED